MKHMWAPWRMKYIEQVDDYEKCIFCNETDLTIVMNEHYSIIMNKFPYNNGHIMVAPRIHDKTIEQLNQREITMLFSGVQIAVKMIQKVYNPDGINIGINMNRAAGAGILDHLHVHLVPRWNGDTNFMPIFSDTKIVSEALRDSKEKLLKAYKEIIDG